MGREDRVKTLSCIYHVHKYVVRLNKPIPPELILKISIIPFELDSEHLLKQYYNTYWHILADRLSYLVKLKTKVNIVKLLPKLTEDIIKVIELYDMVLFCSTILVYIFKKLHWLYSDIDAEKLVLPFKQIFSTLCQKDVSDLRKLPEKEVIDLYVKFNECLYVVADNSSKLHFKDGTLDEVAQKCATLFVHRTDLFYCLQTFYLTLFCKILSCNADITYIEALLTSLESAFGDAKKLGYNKALYVTYPYLNQLLRLYIEYKEKNPKKFSEKIQENCMKLIMIFCRKLKNCNQILKCENCSIKSGLHDAFRLSLLTKHLIQNGTNLEMFYTITTEQYVMLNELETLGCPNHQKYLRKLQTDIHNLAINLNKLHKYETSIKLFNIYLKNELKQQQIEHKNISRTLFNKSISEMDSELYEIALIDAYLSYAFANQDGLSMDKYMNVVMDIKGKELKSRSKDDDETETNELQLLNVLHACKMAMERKLYGNLEPFLKEVKYSTLLQHEFRMYAKQWPSLYPVAGVWIALRELAETPRDNETQDAVSSVLYDIVLETPSLVRTIHSEHFSTIVQELLDEFDNNTSLTVDEKLVHVVLQFLQCEYDLAAASSKYQWKSYDPLLNPDDSPVRRTVPQEHRATRRAAAAVRALAQLAPALTHVSRARLRSALAIMEVFVPQLLSLGRAAPALQLAHCCCQAAALLGRRESYLRSAGELISSLSHESLEEVVERGAELAAGGGGEAELVFMCDVAMYYMRRGKPGAAAKLLQGTRAKILEVLESQPEVDLDLAVGRMLEAQELLYGASGGGPSTLTAVYGAMRHYLAVAVAGPHWSARRLRSLLVRVRTSASVARATRAAAAVGLSARARTCAVHAVTACTALHAHMHTVRHASADHAQACIDDQLKYILGLPTNESQCLSVTDKQKQALSQPKQDLVMRDNMIYRKGQSPTELEHLPIFKIPEFFNHDVDCDCYACDIQFCTLFACKISHIQAKVYAFANQHGVARNFYQGALNMVEIAKNKFEKLKKIQSELYEKYIVESVFENYESELKEIEAKLLLDVGFFELKNKEFEAADERIIDINEIMQEFDADLYLKNDVLNLIAAATILKRSSKKHNVIAEEYDISPVKEELQSTPETPESKITRVRIATKLVVDNEELPQKHVPIKLVLDDDDTEDEPKAAPKKAKFKMPAPILPKAALEEATPRPLRSKPRLLLTEPSVDMATPDSRKEIFHTPINTPEQFFTPISSVKTYSKKSLRQNIVKNLEEEFLNIKSENISLNADKITKIDSERKGKASTSKSNSEEVAMMKENLKEKKDILKEKIDILKDNLKVKKTNLRENLKSKENELPKPTRLPKKVTKEEGAKEVKDSKEAAPRRSRREEKKNLIRAVSPGKLENTRERVSRTKKQ